MKKLLYLLTFVLLANHAAHAQRTILATDANGKFPPGTIASNVFPRGLELGMRSTPFVFDSDAQAYIDRVPIIDPLKALRIHQFVTGLKSLGLCTNVALLADFRANAGTGTTAYSIAGPDFTLAAGASWSANGINLPGGVNSWATVSNSFGSTLSEYTIVAAFNAYASSLAETVISGNGDSAFGPALLAHGSERQAGNVSGWLFHDFGTAATTDFGSVNFAGRVAKDQSATEQKQIAFATYSATRFSLQANTERVWQYSTNGSFGTVYNGAANWRIGADLDGNNRLSGDVAFVCVLKKQLTESQIQSFRRLYACTLGEDYLPRINVIAEGDSLTAGANGVGGWTDNLQKDAVWGPKIQKRIIATGGETSAQMLAQAPAQAGIWRHDFRNADRTWAILWGGANDVNGTDPNTIAGNLFNTITAYKAYGYKVGVCTVIPSAGHNSTGTTNRVALNAIIKAFVGQADAIIKLDEVTELQTTSNTNYFQGDGIHLTVAGQQKVAEKIVSTIPTP